jgi:hypothetical protein
MQQTPPQPPRPAPEVPARAAVVPILPTRVRQPGRQAPLPDAVAVRRLMVPDPAPPFDDEILALTAGNEPTSAAAAGPGAAGQAQGQDRRSPEGDDESSSPAEPPGASGGQPGGGPRRPDPGGNWPSQFAQVLAETLAGSRPAQQLTPWTTEEARRRIRQLGPMLATDQRPKVRRVMTFAPAAGVLEITAVVGFGPRVRALALRLEREQARPHRQAGDYKQAGDRWCCTAIESA